MTKFAAFLAGVVIALMSGAVSAQVCRADIPESSAQWIDNGATVVNALTGLEFRRCVEGQTWGGGTCSGAALGFTWSAALQTAQSTAGGWRLPNAKELETTIDRRCQPVATDGAIFPGSEARKFWTSTPGWAVDQGEGTVIGAQTATTPYAVRLVRAGYSNASFERRIGTAGAVCRTDIPGDIDVANWTPGGSGTISDEVTGLIWQRCALGQTWSGSTCTGSGNTFTWAQAHQAAQAAGTGWRLPNAKELDAMLDRRCAAPAVNPTLFPGAQSAKTWTSTPGWAVDLADGAVLGSQNAADANSVRLVRAGFGSASFERRITAAGAVCRTDIPGDLNVADWTPGANGTVTDTITGLVWQRCALGQTWNGTGCSGGAGSYTWSQALQVASTAGTGWRLPNAKELDAMLDRRCAAPAVNPTLFPGAQSVKTWTSTPGWAVDLTDGAVLGSQNAADANSVRVVRAGFSSASFERRIATAGAVCRNDIPGDLNVADWTPGANGTITDTITGLVWQRCALGQTWNSTGCSGGSGSYTWAQALQAATAAGTGWRLPNAKELDAMLDRRCAAPAVNTSLFPGAQSVKTWTSTPGWAVDLTDGAVLGSQTATDANSVRLVSAGYTYGGGSVVVNGACGTANGVAVATTPTTNLCATGAASPAIPTGPGPWTWSCVGVNTGTTAPCSAPLLDNTPPILSNVSATTIQLTATSNEGSNVYWIALARGAAAPTVVQVRTYATLGAVGVLARGTGPAVATVAAVFTVSGLTATVLYDFYVVAEDAAGNLSLSSLARNVVDAACARSSVAVVAFMDISASLTAEAKQLMGQGALRTTFNVTCASGRFGVVRLPKTTAGALVGEAYALVQTSCSTKPVRRTPASRQRQPRLPRRSHWFAVVETI